MKTFEFWRRRSTELTFALVIVIGIIQASDRISARQKDLLPASAWFEVNEVYVPDFVTGENPLIIYDRVIHEPFRGFFVVEVQKQLPNGLWFSDCSGTGISNYDIDDTIPDKTVKWDWFVNRPGLPCRPGPGSYRLKTTYELRRADWPVKTKMAISNVFHVTF